MLIKFANFAVISVGFVVACLSVGVLFPMANMEFSFTFVLNYFSLTTLLALPGFVILRGLIAWFKKYFLWVFIVAGALNGFGSSAIILREVLWSLALCGAVAGAVCFAVEGFLGPKIRNLVNRAVAS